MDDTIQNFAVHVECNPNYVPSAIELVESESRQHPDNGAVFPPIKSSVNRIEIFFFEKKMEDIRSSGIINILRIKGISNYPIVKSIILM